MGGQAYDWHCNCGNLHLRIAPGPDLAITCYCTYCRYFAQDLGADHILDDAGGTDLAHMTPDRIQLVKGGENLASLTYTKKGALRWFASCCNSPLANTFRTQNVPYVTMIAAGLDPRAGLGASTLRANVKSATAEPPKTTGSASIQIARLFGRTALARILQKHKSTPFFTASGAPSSIPERRKKPSS